MSYLYSIADASIKDASKELLGGKGYGLWKMRQAGFPVPLAYILTTKACRAYMADPASVMAEVKSKLLPEIIAGLTKEFGYMPLVAVRSGARDSMPGMMDTILNVGLDGTNSDGWKDRLGEKCVADSWKRLVEMFANVVHGVDRKTFEGQDLAGCFKFYEASAGKFPSADEQLLCAIEAVFKSWNTERAKTYRKLNGIADDLGTAVVIQAMVFGNLNDKSGTGVAFSRDFSTGANMIVGNWLINGQGEDVVAGIRNVAPLSDMAADMPEAASELFKFIEKLEAMHRDMVDVEFTVQDGTLYLLQVRAGKRTSQAAVRIAVDMVDEGLIKPEEALARVSLKEFLAASRPMVDPTWAAKNPPHAKGIAASIGVATGAAVFSSKDAINYKGDCILITSETTPDDIGGMNAAKGILTATGGTTSHAAVVARGMDKVCIVGCAALGRGDGGKWYLKRGERNGDFYAVIKAGERITLDGSTGAIWLGVDVPVVGTNNECLAKFLSLLETRYPVYRTVTAIEAMEGADKLLVATYAVERDMQKFQKLLLAVNGREALVDLRSYGHFVREADAPLEYLFGDRLDPDVATASKITAIIELSALAEMANAKVLALGLNDSQVSYLKKNGINVVPAVRDISTLLSANGLCTADFAALAKLMSNADLNKLLALKKNVGETVRSFNIVEGLDVDQFGRNALFAMSPIQLAQSFLRPE